MRLKKAVAVLIFTTPLCVVVPCGTEALARRRYETKLAGLRPGKDTLDDAYKRFGRNTVDQRMSSPPTLVAWYNPCSNQELTVIGDASGVIQKIVVEAMLGAAIVDCSPKGYSRRFRARFGTSRDLLFDDRCERIQEIYDAPESSRFSKVGDEKFLSCLYTFNARGVQLDFEVRCKVSTDQVDKLELAVATH